LILKNKNKIYFICTNFLEIFNLYLKLIQFFSNQIIFWFLSYNILIFLMPALYKHEFFNFKKLIIILTLNWCLNFKIIVSIIFPITYKFFEKFQYLIFNLIHFEIKIDEFFFFFMKTYFLIQFNMFFFVLLIFFFQKFYYNKMRIQKYRKLNFFLMNCYLTFLNLDFFTQIIFCLLFVSFYELFLLVYFFNNKIIF
jgi:hypothetical protein